ncbi:MAG: hypothetical protein JO112_02210, partial [Planctomycetes bacterium]|nr:hypothetical protein [Planctomycetota bacterium]
ANPPREQTLPEDQQAGAALGEAYETLTLTTIWINSYAAKLTQDYGPLFNRAKEFYGAAHRAYRERRYHRALALAAAANDAAGGLLLVLRAYTPAIPDLPIPPEPPVSAPEERKGSDPADRPPDSPEAAAREALRYVRQHLEGNEADRGPGREFRDASRDLYEQARRALQGGDNRKALQLGQGAAAWIQVADDMRDAEQGERRRPEEREVPSPYRSRIPPPLPRDR